MDNKSFKIQTLGCKANQYDSAVLKAKLRGFGLKPSEKNVDFFFINTCSVTKTAILKCKKACSKAKIENPNSRIIILGCWPKVYRKEAEKLEADYIFTSREYEKIISKIFPKNENHLCNSGFEREVTSVDRSRYFVKIQDGCEQYCSYCIIPYARGKMRSRKEKEILEEISMAGKNGFEEIVLSGIHIGLFGKEKGNNEDTNLSQLLRKISKLKEVKRIRISSIEITEIDDQLIEMMSTENKLCSHLHISLQSGSDKTLKRMNRPYNTSYFEDKVRRVRARRPDIAITTDIIVGFPGETEDDFEKTYDFCKKMNFSKIHVFSFSAHEKTPAFNMDNKVSPGEISKRSQRLRKLSNLLEDNYKSKFIGSNLDVVLSRRVRDGFFEGKTRYSFGIKFSEKDLVNGEKMADPGKTTFVNWKG